MAFPAFSRFSGEYQGAQFGAFTASYHSGLSTLVIRVKVHWDWQNAQNQTPWTGQEKLDFKKKFRKGIEQVWDGKWKFVCTANGFRGTEAKVKFTVEDGTAIDNHFVFRVSNNHGQAYLNAGNNYVQLYRTDVDQIEDTTQAGRQVGMSAGGIMSTERRKIEQALQAVGDIQLTGSANNWQVAANSQALLRTLNQSLNRVGPHAPKYPLIATASSGIQSKANGMILAVSNFMRQVGCRYPVQTRTNVGKKRLSNPFAARGTTASVSLALSDDDQGVRDSYVHRYRAAIHEFGHCLGLPDEYQPNYPTMGTAAHDAWRALCNDAGINARNVPKFDISIMSCGWRTDACHYVTLWDALGQLTSAHVNRTDWSIERDQEPDYL